MEYLLNILNNFKNGDFDQYRHLLLNIPWHDCYVRSNVNSTVRNWFEMLMHCVETCIPHCQATIRSNDKPFMNSSIRKSIQNMTVYLKDIKKLTMKQLA